MPLYATGFEAGSFSFYEGEGWAGSGTIETHFVHAKNGFGGRYALRAPVNTGVRTPVLPGSPRWAHCWISFAGDTSQPNSMPIFFNEVGISTHITIRLEDTGFIQIRRGNTIGSLLATSSGSLDWTVGHWFAIEVVVANAGGVVNVYVDDDPTPFVAFTGDTQNGGSAFWDTLQFAAVTGASCVLDDLIVTDNAEGQLAETFGRRVIPTSDDATALTPSVGSDNYKNVVDYNTSTYNSTGSGTTEDLYGSEGNLRLGTVDFVQITAVGQFQNNFDLQTALKSGATTAYGPLATGTAASRPLPTTIYTTDPDTASAWTEAGVNGIQQGVRSGS